MLAQHAQEPLQVPGAAIRDYVIEVVDAGSGRVPAHRSARTNMGYPTHDDAERRVAQIVERCAKRERPPVLRIVARRRRT